MSGIQIFTIDFCLCGAILYLKAFSFGAIPDIMIELIAYWSVPQSRQSWQWLSGIETKLLGTSFCFKLENNLDNKFRDLLQSNVSFSSH
jgi:peptide subunit release factor RF-3